MKRIAQSVVLLLILLAGETSGAPPVPFRPAVADSLAVPAPLRGLPILEAPDTVRVEAHRSAPAGPGGRRSLTRRDVKLIFPGLGPPAPAAGSLAPRTGGLLPPPATVRLSRFGTAAYGADRGANAGLWLGGLGHILGLWSEEDALRMTAAGAVLGALWGGTAGAADDGFRIRVR